MPLPIQPSASRTKLLLGCPRPFEVPAEPDESGEPARYGSAFHQVAAACLGAKTSKGVLEKTDRYAKEIDKAAKAYDVRAAAGELAGHVKSSLGVLRNWLAREKLEVLALERAYAVTLAAGAFARRVIEPHDEDHRYDTAPDEVPGTVDLIACGGDREIVIDYKTGSAPANDILFATPTKIPQMRTLGLVATHREVEVGIFHADRRGLPNMYVEPYELDARHAHAGDLRRALGLIGNGFLRVGEHCAECPVRATCPAHQAELISEGTNALIKAANGLATEPITGALVSAKASKLSVEERAGLLHTLLKKFGVLEKAGREEIRRLVKGGAVIETPEGKTLVIREQTFETLSKKSVLAAYGPQKGEKVLEKLRKDGAVVESTREMLVGE